MEYEKLCPNCDSPLKVLKGPYGEFYGCPNFKSCGFKGSRIDGATPKKEDNFKLQKVVSGNEEVMTAIRELYKELKAHRAEFDRFAQIFGGKTTEEEIKIKY